MDERLDSVLNQARRGELHVQVANESQNGGVRKAVGGNDIRNDTVLDGNQRGESGANNTGGEIRPGGAGSAPDRSQTGSEQRLQALDDIWDKTAVNRQNGLLDAVQETRELLATSFVALIQDGKRAHREWARVQQELDLANEYISSKTQEIQRLRALDAKNRENISKLLRTVTSTNETTKERSKAKVSEATLRSDLLQMTKSRDKAMEELARVEKRCKVLEKDLAGVKSKLGKEQQARKQMERDQQAAMSLANSFHTGNQSDVDFYKRKVTELSTHVQGLTGILSERNREIELLRREKDRFLTQNQQASRRKEAKGTKRSRK